MPYPLPLALVSLLCAITLLLGGCSSAPTAASTNENKLTTQPASVVPAEAVRPHKLAVVLLTPENIMSVNFAAEDLGPWLQTAMSDCEEVLSKETNPPRVLLQITLRKNSDPIYEFSGRPKLSTKLKNALQESLAPLPPIHPPYCDISVRLQHIDDKDGSPLEQAALFEPQPVSPEIKALEQFQKNSIADEYLQLRTWAREEALPMLGAMARGVDPKFVGVINMGKLLGSTELTKHLEIEALTFRNPDYWRGIMEMAPGNAGITAMPILLFVANGEFDKANKLLQLVRPFSASEPLGSNLLDALGSRLSILNNKVADEIKHGITLHDTGKYDRAIEAYKQILAVYPCSAWARYELFFSELHKRGPKALVTEGAESWRVAAPEIFGRDPLYTTQFTGVRGKSMGELLDRLSLKILKNGKINDPGELVGRTAELAVRLECYGYAAHIYWLSMNSKLTLKESGLPEKKEFTSLKTEDIICRYLYCLEKLGCPEWKKEFRNDFSAQFTKFDTDLEKHRKQ